MIFLKKDLRSGRAELDVKLVNRSDSAVPASSRSITAKLSPSGEGAHLSAFDELVSEHSVSGPLDFQGGAEDDILLGDLSMKVRIETQMRGGRPCCTWRVPAARDQGKLPD